MPPNLSRWTDAIVTTIAGALAPIVDRLAGVDGKIADLDRRMGDADARTAAMVADGAVQHVATRALTERLTALEQAPPPAGVPGPPGERGADGIGFASPPVSYDGVRSFTFHYSDGTESVFTPPLLIYQGVYVDGRPYAPGDAVTHSGNLWHCNQTTTIRPGADVRAWTLIVRRGRDRKER